MKSSLFAAIALLTVFFQPNSYARTPITMGQLAGTWVIALIGDTGCGISTSYVIVTLNASGSGMATNRSHTSGCGNPVQTEPFAINTLNREGNGTANLSCGPACGWEFKIQVGPSVQVFNLVDVDPNNPGNYLEGTAVRQE